MPNWNTDKPYYFCTRLRMLEFLRRKGFYPIRTLPDVKDPRYSVWMFENSPELIEAVDEFLTQQKNRLK